MPVSPQGLRPRSSAVFGAADEGTRGRMSDDVRDPEEAIRDITDRVAEGDEPSAEEREFLEGEGVERAGSDEAPGLASG